MRRVLGHVRGGILGRLSFQELVGIFVDRIEYIAGGYRGVLNDRELWKLDCVPLRLWLEQL
jgi:hypothetical protein